VLVYGSLHAVPALQPRWGICRIRRKVLDLIRKQLVVSNESADIIGGIDSGHKKPNFFLEVGEKSDRQPGPKIARNGDN
jgi:hypothetical protein